MKDLYDEVFFYDLVHGDFAGEMTFDFYNRQISLHGAPILELACGSGHLLIPLAEKGIDITGLDSSEKMLAACERKAFERNVKVNIHRADMRNFELNKKFKLILIGGNSFPHLLKNKDISACFDCVKRHLATDGKLIIENQNPFVPLLAREPGRKFMIGAFGEYVLTEDVNYAAATQINYKNWHFWHRPTDRITTLSLSQRQIFPQEFAALFKYEGFRIEKNFGDFDESEFSDSSPKQIFVASLL